MSLTAQSIQHSLVGYYESHLWNPLRCLAVKNCCVAGWESDLLIIHPSGNVWEVEIKVSVSDLRAEFRNKNQKHKALITGNHAYRWGKKETIVQKFFIAMPIDIWQKAQDLIPDYCGVITVDPATETWGFMVPTIQQKAKRLPCRKITDEERQQVLKSIYLRSWKQRAGVEE